MKFASALLFLLLTITSYAAEELPLPSSIPSIDGLAETYRSPLTKKIQELSENFISDIRENEINWRSHIDFKCGPQNIIAGLSLSKVTRSVSMLKPTELYEEIRYYDCSGAVNLKEIIITNGSNLEPASMNEVIKGQRTLKLKATETFRDYRIINTFNDQLTRITITETPDLKTTVMYLAEAPFLEIFQTKESEQNHYTYRFRSANVAYRYRNAHWEINNAFEPWTIAALVEKSPKGPIYRYYNSHGQQTSFSKFLNGLTYGTITNPHGVPPLAHAKNFINAHLKFFPETQIVASVGQNDRILNELRLAQIRLTNNVEINLVKNLVTEYLNAIETGTIKFTDNRKEN